MHLACLSQFIGVFRLVSAFALRPGEPGRAAFGRQARHGSPLRIKPAHIAHFRPAPSQRPRALRELRRAHVAAAYGARQPLQLPRLLLQVQTQLLLAELQVMPRRRQLALSVLRAQIPKRRRNRGQKQQHRRQRRNGRQALLPQQALPPVSPRRLRRQKRIASHGRAV